MRLLSLEVLPRDPRGWRSQKHDLNQNIIVFQAANGSGKTPLLKCLVYGLGQHIELPTEILDNCSAVKTEILAAGEKYVVTRDIETAFKIVVEKPSDSSVTSFNKEKEYSIWFASLLGLSQVDLTTTKRAQTSLYSSVLIPMFWIDQDRGWSKTYFSEKNFIWDQEEELTRLFLNLPIRHPFSQRDSYETAKADLSAIESRLEINNRAIAQERRDLGDAADGSVELYEKEILQIQTRLEEIGSDLCSTKRIAGAFDDRIHELKRELQKIVGEKSLIEQTRQRFNSVEKELNGEIELLGTNVSAARAFKNFCGNEKCQLLVSSEASYGKRLLYLADQVKDIGREVVGLSAKIRTLSLHESDIQKQIQQIESTKNLSLSQAGQDQPINLLKNMISRLANLERTKGRIEKLGKLKAEFNRLYSEKDRQKGLVENLSPKRSNRGAGRIRNLLSESFKFWLGVLGTRSLPSPITFDDNLRMSFSGQDLRGFSGSTLLRILLAYRTSLYEVSKSVNGSHPGVLIMDAPRQHEIKVEDFASYFENIHRKLAHGNDDLQIIISLSDEIFPRTVPSLRIEPTFEMDGQLKYFGPITV